MPYLYPLFLFAAALFCTAGGIFLLTCRKENLAVREKLPRAKIPGFLLGCVVLLWCIPHASPILPESLHRYLLPLAVLLAILCWIALDHLLARALAGFMILSAHYFLRESFAAPAPGSGLFAFVCLIFGTIGIWFSGRPYDMRDLIRASIPEKRLFRWIMPCFLFLFAICSFWTGICAAAGVRS